MGTAPVVEVANLGNFKYDIVSLKRAFAKALAFLRVDDVLVEILLVPKNVMVRINEVSCGKHGPTTVLSFPEPEDLPNPPRQPRPIGEIYLAPDVIVEQGQDVTRLAVHGLLHLLGYTHNSERDTIEMETLECKVWEMLSPDST